MIYIKTKKEVGKKIASSWDDYLFCIVSKEELKSLEIGEFELICLNEPYDIVEFQKAQTIILNKLMKKYGEQ